MGISANKPAKANIFSQFRQVKPPKSMGELKETLSLYHSKRVPVMGEEGAETTQFKREITPYADMWGKLVQHQRLHLSGQSVEGPENISHAFIIRADQGHEYEKRDYVLWDGRTLALRGVMLVTGTEKWELLLCEEAGLWTDEVKDDTTLPNDPETGADIPAENTDPDNPLWR